MVLYLCIIIVIISIFITFGFTIYPISQTTRYSFKISYYFIVLIILHFILYSNLIMINYINFIHDLDFIHLINFFNL